MASRQRLCSVCCQQQARYTCPRCHKVYCSADCYRQHSQTCSEAFYREQATAQLKATRAGPEQTQHMLEVLQRLHEQQQAAGGFNGHERHGDDSSGSSDGGDPSDSDAEEAAAAEAAALGPALRKLLKRAAREGPAFEVQASDLTPELQQQLEALSLKGQLSHLVPVWDPWWESETAAGLQLNSVGQRVVQDMQELHHQEQGQQQGRTQQQQQQQGQGSRSKVGTTMKGCLQRTVAGPSGVPCPPDDPLPSLQQLAGATHRPSPLLPWQLLQLLVAYCAVMRRFNGEPETDGWDAAQQLLLLAPPLVQAALAAGGSKGGGPSAPLQQQSQQQQQDPAQQPQQHQDPAQQPQQQQAGASIPPPDSVRGACLQLMDAAAASEGSMSGDNGSLLQQLTATAAAVSCGGGTALTDEARALLQCATADGLKLLQLGRSAVVLALHDTYKILQGAREAVKQQQQQQQQESPAGGRVQQAPAKQRQLLQQLRRCLLPAAQKAWYFVVWSNQQAPRVYQCLAEELGAELQGQQAMAHQSLMTGGGVSLTGRPSVESSGPPRIQPVLRPQQQQQQPSVEVLTQSAEVQERTASSLYDLD